MSRNWNTTGQEARLASIPAATRRLLAVGIFISIGMVFLPLPIYADPLLSTIHVEGTASMPLTLDEKRAIAQELKQAFDFNRNKSGWTCANPVLVEEDELPALPQSGKKGAQIKVVVDGAPGTKDALITVTTDFVGKPLVIKETVTYGLMQDDRTGALKDGARKALEDLLDQQT